jgi:hypothetical protein
MQHVVSQLITKKQELIGELNYHKAKVEQLQEVIGSIAVSIKAFDPDFDLSTVKPKRYTGKRQFFEHGESHRMTLDALRKAGKPLTTGEICRELMKRKKLDTTDKELVDSVQKSLLNTLKRQEDNQLIKSTSKENYK